MNKRHSTSSSPKRLWLYGKHACVAALENPDRHVHHIWITRNNLPWIQPYMQGIAHSVCEPKDLAKQLPEGAVHQGIALEVSPLPAVALEDMMEEASLLVVLDQVTDPHNVGAILRSAAAFGADAVVVHDRHAPKESSIIAKSASGALDIVPLISVTNIVYSLQDLKKEGFWIVGMAGDAPHTLAQLSEDAPQKIALVMGAEGEGLRRLTYETCDYLVRLPMDNRMESLNVSNAAAIALYELQRDKLEE
jgi:23S rRNA (guanosine2251-2'-O)-methyltransferase